MTLDDFDGYDDDSSDSPQGNDFEFDSDVLFDSSDIDPIFIGGVDLNDEGTLFANIYSEPGADIDRDNIDLSGIEDLLGLTDDDTTNFRGDLSDLPPDFDYDAETVRGPFESEEEVIDWLNETGLWGVSDWFYDAQHNEYYIDISGTP